MDGIVAGQQRMKPAVDPAIAGVKLPVLFAWLAEAEPTAVPAIVFERTPVADIFPPPKRRKRSDTTVLEATLVEVPVHSGEVFSIAVPNISTAPDEQTDLSLARMVFQEAKAPEHLEPLELAKPIAEPPAPPPVAVLPIGASNILPMLPPPLISPVIKPRPKPSRIDDFLPGRADFEQTPPRRR